MRRSIAVVLLKQKCSKNAVHCISDIDSAFSKASLYGRWQPSLDYQYVHVNNEPKNFWPFNFFIVLMQFLSSTKCPQGGFSINLKSTGFKISSKQRWKLKGNGDHMEMWRPSSGDSFTMWRILYGFLFSLPMYSSKLNKWFSNQK